MTIEWGRPSTFQDKYIFSVLKVVQFHNFKPWFELANQA